MDNPDEMAGYKSGKQLNVWTTWLCKGFKDDQLSLNLAIQQDLLDQYFHWLLISYNS